MKRHLMWFLKCSVASGILYYIFSIIPMSDVISAVSTCQVRYLVLVPIVLFLERLSRAMRMQVLTSQVGISLSTMQLWDISLVSAFYSLFLPGELGGGAVRWYRVSRPDNKPVEAMVAITFDRLIDTIVVIVLGILFWLFESPSTRHALAGVLFVSALGAALVLMSIIFSQRVSTRLLSLLENGSTARWAAFLHDKLNTFSRSVTQYRGLSKQASMNILVISITRCALTVAFLYLIALSVSVQLSVISVVWVCSFISIVTMLPFSFSGLGIREGSLILLLAPYGIAGASAVAVSLLLYLSRVLIGVVGGVLEARHVLLTGIGSKA